MKRTIKSILAVVFTGLVFGTAVFAESSDKIYEPELLNVNVIDECRHSPSSVYDYDWDKKGNKVDKKHEKPGFEKDSHHKNKAQNHNPKKWDDKSKGCGKADKKCKKDPKPAPKEKMEPKTKNASTSKTIKMPKKGSTSDYGITIIVR